MSAAIISRFCFHKADTVAQAKMRVIRQGVRGLALVIDACCPESREKATALTQLATVMMHANSAIVQQCPIDENDLDAEELSFFQKGVSNGDQKEN